MPGISVEAVTLKTQPLSAILLTEQHVKELTPADNDAFLKLSEKIEGYVLQKPLGTEKDGSSLWTFVSGDLIRVPIFRYNIPEVDPDQLAMAAMEQLLQIGRLEEAENIANVRQRILLRRTVVKKKHLYMGVVVRLL
jgi:hypothetical protein